MFSSDEWNGSQWACKQDGKDTKMKIFKNTFYQKIAEVVKIERPHCQGVVIGRWEKIGHGLHLCSYRIGEGGDKDFIQG